MNINDHFKWNINLVLNSHNPEKNLFNSNSLLEINNKECENKECVIVSRVDEDLFAQEKSLKSFLIKYIFALVKNY